MMSLPQPFWHRKQPMTTKILLHLAAKECTYKCTGYKKQQQTVIYSIITPPSVFRALHYLFLRLNLGSCDCLAKVIWTKPWQTKGNSKSEVLVVKMTMTFSKPHTNGKTMNLFVSEERARKLISFWLSCMSRQRRCGSCSNGVFCSCQLKLEQHIRFLVSSKQESKKTNEQGSRRAQSSRLWKDDVSMIHPTTT